MIALFPSNPTNMTLAFRDSGVFLYVGWRLLNGDIPYRDVWDHKPPLIYFVDALGIALTPALALGSLDPPIPFYFFHTLFHLQITRSRIWNLCCAGRHDHTHLGFVDHPRKRKRDRGICTLYFRHSASGCSSVHGEETFLSALRSGSAYWAGSPLISNKRRLASGSRTRFFYWRSGSFQRKFPLKDLLLIADRMARSIDRIGRSISQAREHLVDYWEQAFLYNFVYIGKHEGIRRLIPVFIKGFAYLQNGWVLYLSILGWLAGLGYGGSSEGCIHPGSSVDLDRAGKPAYRSILHYDLRAFHPSLLPNSFTCHGNSGGFLTVRQLVSQKGVRLRLIRSREEMDGTVVEQLGGIDYVRAANTQELRDRAASPRPPRSAAARRCGTTSRCRCSAAPRRSTRASSTSWCWAWPSTWPSTARSASATS